MWLLDHLKCDLGYISTVQRYSGDTDFPANLLSSIYKLLVSIVGLLGCEVWVMIRVL